MNKIEIRHLSKKYGKQLVLNDLSLTLEEGKIYGLLGRNGIGKSTLLNILTNRIFKSSGEISYQGELLNGFDCPQSDFYLMSETTLFNKNHQLKQVIANTKLLQKEFNQPLCEEMFQAFALDKNKKITQLSTGYRTIFKAILALCVPAKFVFLDEPVLGLDANHREMLYRFILKAYDIRPRTIVLSTHIIEEIANLIEHVIILGKETVLVDEVLEDVLAKAYRISGPKNDVATYCAGLTVLDHEQIGEFHHYYIFDELDHHRIIPDRLKIEHVDLQQLFIKLTQEKGLKYV